MPTLYRVENQVTMGGLWYNEAVEKTDFIKTIPNAMNRDLPMDFDPTFAGGWYSAGESIPQMRNWFSANDMMELEKAGYHLYKIDVKDYRRVPGHVLFRREGAIFTRVPIDLLDYK